MSKRKRKKSTKGHKFIFEMYGVAMISFAIFVFTSIYYNIENIIPRTINNVIRGLTGLGAFIVPFLILLLGIGLIIKRDRMTLHSKFHAFCALYILSLIFIGISKSVSMGYVTFVDRITISYTNGINSTGGGVIGEVLAYPIIRLLGIVGTYLFAGTFIIINILILTNASIYKISVGIKKKITGTYTVIYKLFKKSPENIVQGEISAGVLDARLQEQGDGRSKYIEDINKKIKILDFFKSSEIGNNTEGKDMDDNIMEEHQPTPQHKVNNTPDKEFKIQDEISASVKQHPPKYIYPSTTLLNYPSVVKGGSDKKELISNAKTLEETLESFGVEARVVQVSRGPVITRYELQPSPGVKVSKIVNLSDDIALNLAAPAVRIEAPIPGKAAVGIEVPNREMSTVFLREVIESKEFTEHPSSMAFALGKDVAGNCIVSDLSKMPHLLIAGATGSGKSVCINTLITSILYKASPERVRLLMIDPKVVELSTYNGIPHLLIPVVTDPRKAAGALGWAVQEMTNRYKAFADSNVRNIESYNILMTEKNPDSVLPQIIVIIDELADLMMIAPNDVEDCICRLAQMARAAGMHLVVATQRPSVDVITGVIKANIPSRVSFAVSSQIDSRTILDMAGAEKLLGKGDMLYYPVGESKPVRVQGAFVSEKEVEQVVSFVKGQSASEYKQEIIDEIGSINHDSGEVDELLAEAISIVVEMGQASISLLQRRLRIGYNRAARLIDSMEARGIVGGYEGSKPRQVLITREEHENMK